MKQKINDIDLRRLLLGRGMMLKQWADVDREEGVTGDLPGDLLPVGEGGWGKGAAGVLKNHYPKGLRNF